MADRVDQIANVLYRHVSYDGPEAYTWSCACGVDFHDAPSHFVHVARVLDGVFPGVAAAGLGQP